MTYELVKGKKNLKWIQEPFHIFNKHRRLLTIIRKSSIVNVVSFLEPPHETLWMKTKYTLFFFAFTVKLMHKM